MTVIGFTGTRHGMRIPQLEAVSALLRDLRPTMVHHGGCIGADYEFHCMAAGLKIAGLNIAIDVHPCNIKSMQANCTRGNALYMDERPPLERNRHIVDSAAGGLIATPHEATEQPRGGTWYTVRYARKIGRRVWLVLPDGTIA